MKYEDKVAKRMKERAERLRPPGYRDRVTAEAQAKQAAKEAGDKADAWLKSYVKAENEAKKITIGAAVFVLALSTLIVWVLT